MKSLIFLLLGLFVHSLLSASELSNYCQKDPSGEIFSEITDAVDMHDAMSSIGLNLDEYLVFFNELEGANNMSLEDFASASSQQYPEIESYLQLWKLQTCIDRGYDMLLNSKNPL